MIHAYRAAMTLLIFVSIAAFLTLIIIGVLELATGQWIGLSILALGLVLSYQSRNIFPVPFRRTWWYAKSPGELYAAFWGHEYVDPANICDGCGNEVDWEVCHCGTEIDRHHWGDGHMPVPMGCDCLRNR